MTIPDKLMALQAYYMWEDAGRPNVSMTATCSFVPLRALCVAAACMPLGGSMLPGSSTGSFGGPCPSCTQGADFGAAARNRIEDKLRSGVSLKMIEQELRTPSSEERHQLEKQHQVGSGDWWRLGCLGVSVEVCVCVSVEGGARSLQSEHE